MTFGFDAPLVVDGRTVDLQPDARISNRYVEVPFEGRDYEIRDGDAALSLDFDRWNRTVENPRR